MEQPSLFGIQDTGISWPSILTPAALQEVSQEHGRIILFTGHRSVLALGHYLLAWRTIEEESVVFVDGANFFDITLITKLCRQLQQDSRKVLERILISRAFTVHQIEAVIGKQLESALNKYSGRLCFISGLLDTFFDEEVPMWEAVRILHRVMERFKALAHQGYRVVVLAPSSPVPIIKRMGLVSLTMKSSDRIFTLSQDKDEFVLKDAKTEAGKQWILPVLQLPAKRYSVR